MRRCGSRGRAHKRLVAARPASSRALPDDLMLVSRPPGCSPAAFRSAAALCGTGIYPSRTVTMHGGIFRPRTAFSPPARPRRSQATPAAFRSAAALFGTGIYPSRTVTMHGGIFRPRTAFSPPARLRRSRQAAEKRRLRPPCGVAALAGVLTTGRLLRAPLHAAPCLAT